MNRIARAARYAALLLLCLLAAPAGVRAQNLPNFVSPSLFAGFEPIEPDDTGLSPNFQYLVVNDGDQIHVIRLFDEIEVFHPDRMASRILGLGDMLTLIEKAEQSFDAAQKERAEEIMREGSFTLEDFLEQLAGVETKAGSR